MKKYSKYDEYYKACDTGYFDEDWYLCLTVRLDDANLTHFIFYAIFSGTSLFILSLTDTIANYAFLNNNYI